MFLFLSVFMGITQKYNCFSYLDKQIIKFIKTTINTSHLEEHENLYFMVEHKRNGKHINNETIVK